jgi:hypothetical protein
MMRCKHQARIAVDGIPRAPQVRDVHPQRDNQRQTGRQTALKPARGTDADKRPHEESQVESAGVDDQAFQVFAWPRRCIRRRPPVS